MAGLSSTTITDDGRDTTKKDKSQDDRPSPADFEAYLPWACAELQLTYVPVITRVTQNSYMPRQSIVPTKRRKSIINKEDMASLAEQGKSNARSLGNIIRDDTMIYIDSIYDSNDDLIQLKFRKNKNIPNTLLRIISHILPFYSNLTAFYIPQGLNQNGVYELSKIVSIYPVTDIILDDTVIDEANYYLLLENSCLKYLSLSRCKLNDKVVETLASRLVLPHSASTKLSVLNLSSNRITDEGARYLGDALRKNRQLAYLNLSDNMITDTGADVILNSLMQFPITHEEMNQKKVRHFNYLKEKKNLVMKTIENMQSEDQRKKLNKQFASPTSKKNKTLDSDEPCASIGFTHIDPALYDKAETMTEDLLGPFKDPFHTEKIFLKNEVLYCMGNNSLCYLSLAYNNITYFSIKKLHQVLRNQDTLNQKPRGLINVCIEGNNIPESCMELNEIDDILRRRLARGRTISALPKKKPLIRTK